VRRGHKFIAKVNPQWWPELVKKAQALIGDKVHDYVVFYSEEKGLHWYMCNR